MLFSLSLAVHFPLFTFWAIGLIYFICVAVISTLSKVDIWRMSDQRENQTYVDSSDDEEMEEGSPSNRIEMDEFLNEETDDAMKREEK